MKQSLVKQLIVWGGLAICVPLMLVSQMAGAIERVPNQVILKLGNSNAADKVLKAFNATLVRSVGNRNVVLISIPNDRSLDNVIRNARRMQGVISSQPNYRFSLPEADQVSQIVPDEQHPGLNMGVSPPDYFGQPQMYLNADSANLISTGESVVVAVIDNGIAFDHPLFDGVIANNGYDFIDNDLDASEKDGPVLGHGTFVSGIILRIAPDCQIVPLRAFDENGVGTSFAVSQAIYWAIDNQVDIINMSFSMFNIDPLIAEAVSAAAVAGITMIASPGNEGLEILAYPAAFDEVISVPAVDSLDYRADFSNYGGYVDVCAPGVFVYSSLAGAYDWGRWSGTSFSAPMVAAVCALLISVDQSLESNNLKTIIRSTADKDLNWGTILPGDPEYGDGRADAFDAVLSQVRGDVDGSGIVNILDVNYLISHVHHGGPAPMPVMDVGDMDESGTIDQNDIDALINLLDL